MYGWVPDCGYVSMSINSCSGKRHCVYRYTSIQEFRYQLGSWTLMVFGKKVYTQHLNPTLVRHSKRMAYARSFVQNGCIMQKKKTTQHTIRNEKYEWEIYEGTTSLTYGILSEDDYWNSGLKICCQCPRSYWYWMLLSKVIWLSRGNYKRTSWLNVMTELQYGDCELGFKEELNGTSDQATTHSGRHIHPNWKNCDSNT